MFDVEDLERAARACMKRKRHRPDAIAFRMRQGEEVLGLARRLQEDRYRPQPGMVFATKNPKPREVHAAAFRDRVVHHLLHHLLEPRFERKFISDSFACRKGKGTHAAALRLQTHLRDSSRHGNVRVWVLKMDVRNFFNTIHKPTLLELLARGFDRAEREARPPSLWSVTRSVVMHDPTKGARPKGDPRAMDRVPPGKRLGSNGPERGLPIGNLTSQLFANIYLDALDRFVKRTLGIRRYVRYVDDFVLVHPDRSQLRECEVRIRRFLAERLKIEAHARAELRPASEGIDFVGYIVRPGYLLPRRRVVRAMNRALASAEEALGIAEIPRGAGAILEGVGSVRGPCTVIPIHHDRIERLRAVWASYRGHLAIADCFGLMRRIRDRHPISTLVLAERRGLLGRRFALPRLDEGYRDQVKRLRVGIGPAILVVKMGSFADCPVHHDARQLGLRWRRGRVVGRAGFPWMMVNESIRRGLAAGLPVAVAVEHPPDGTRLRRREIAFIVTPDGGEGLPDDRWPPTVFMKSPLFERIVR